MSPIPKAQRSLENSNFGEAIMADTQGVTARKRVYALSGRQSCDDDRQDPRNSNLELREIAFLRQPGQLVAILRGSCRA